MTDKKQVLKDADAEIAAFEQWFRSHGAEPLARFEKAILKTFIVAKETGMYGHAKKEADSDEPAPESPHYLPA